MGAIAAVSIAGAEMAAQEAHAGGYSVESQATAARFDQALETRFPGYDFDVFQNPLAKKMNLEVHIQKEDGQWEASGYVVQPDGMSPTALDGYLFSEVEKMIADKTTESKSEKRAIDTIIESINITPAAEKIIGALGGDSIPRIGKLEGGEDGVILKLSKDETVAISSDTAALWVGQAFNDAGKPVLQVKLLNEDGTGQIGNWSLDGKFETIIDIPVEKK